MVKFTLGKYKMLLYNKTMKKFLTRDQIAELSYVECRQELDQLEKDYDMEQPLSLCFEEIWPILDDLANMLLELEDAIWRFETNDKIQMSLGRPSSLPIPHRVPPKIKTIEKDKPVYSFDDFGEPKVSSGKRGRPKRRFQIGDVIYDDIEQAVRKTGIKLHSLRSYVTRKPNIYKYVN